MVGYATIYTMAPVFSLVLDRDVTEDLALLYPELYKELTKVSLSVGKGEVLLIETLIGSFAKLQDLLRMDHNQSLPRYMTAI